MTIHELIIDEIWIDEMFENVWLKAMMVEFPHESSEKFNYGSWLSKADLVGIHNEDNF